MKNKMIQEGKYDLAKRTIANAVVSNLNYNLNVFAFSEEKTSELIKLMKDKYVTEFELLNWKEEDYHKRKAYNRYAEEILGIDIEKYKKRIKELTNSKSYKIGRKITKIPRTLRKLKNR